jgi:NAD(P)H-hydrate repair Nnr-like enzyme with NAD(P)H-hydrate dehydratase domain
MSWLILGTVPYEGFPLFDCACKVHNGFISLGEGRVPIARGTPALLAAACIASEVLGTERPRALVAGDIGKGDGSRRVHEYFSKTLPDRQEDLMVFHYLQPDVDWHNRILWQIEELSKKPLLIADAGYMYVAKMSGFAPFYDLFTPDAGELAFLADESAPHPFYTRGFLFQEEERVPESIERAFQHENAARHLLVKGKCDYVATMEGIIERICDPCVEAMEPIGGTGDSLSGIVAGLVASGRSMAHAAIMGTTINRLLGLISHPTPAHSVSELLLCLSRAIERYFRSEQHYPG